MMGVRDHYRDDVGYGGFAAHEEKYHKKPSG